MDVQKPDNRGLSVAINTLKKGGLVICPSDTVYGLLVDAKNEKAVAKLMAFKNRPAGKPVSVFVPGLERVDDYVLVSDKERETLNELLPGPFTVILPSRHAVSRHLESERGTLGIRIPDYPFVRDLVSTYGTAVTATSANLSGRPPHHSFETLMHELSASKKTLIDLAIDGGKLQRNKPSTIVDLTGSQVRLIRKGDVIPKNTKVYLSRSVGETEKTAAFIIAKTLKKNAGLPTVVILEGDMGAGKTVFVKGAASLFHINNIVSPTFVVSYEYDVNAEGLTKFVHADLFNIEEPEEFNHLGLEEYMKSGSILFIEWGEKAGELLPLLKEKARIIHITMKYLSPEEREITVHEQ